MNAFRVVTFAAMLTAATAIAQTPAQPAEPPVEPPDPTTPLPRTLDLPDFRTLDINGDGELSKDEARANTVVTKHFDELDEDKNGTLSREEYAKAKSLVKRPGPGQGEGV